MSIPLVAAFYVLVWLAAICLALLWCAGRRREAGGAPRLLLLAVGAVLLTLLLTPVGGLAGWSRAYSYWTNPSVPLLGLIAVALWGRIARVGVFRPEDWRSAFVFGAVAGLLVYLPPLAGGTLDLYYWGWDSRVALWGLAAAAAAFLAAGSRVGVLLFGSLVAYAIDALESRNCWDYVIDPVYWMISLGWVSVRGIRWLRTRRRRAGGNTEMPEAPAVAEPRG